MEFKETIMAMGALSSCAQSHADLLEVHPGEDTFYRPDKAFHFLSSQIVVDHFGFILRISVAKGRNNDSATFKLKKMEKGWQLLGDLGYGSVQVLKPIGDPAGWRFLINSRHHIWIPWSPCQREKWAVLLDRGTRRGSQQCAPLISSSSFTCSLEPVPSAAEAS